MEVPARNLTNSEMNLSKLIIAIGQSSNDTTSKRLEFELYKQLCDEFYDKLHKIAYKKFSGIPDIEEIIKDIFQEALILLLKKLREGFQIDESLNDADCKKILILFLHRAANRLILSYYRRKKIADEMIDIYKFEIDLENSDRSSEKRQLPKYAQEKLNIILKKMKPIKREILNICLEYGTLTAGENTKHLPDKAIKYLMKKYNKSSATIRKIKERAIKEIKSCLD